jgi:hypothetical protein
LHFICIDDAGSSNTKDNSRYYVLSATIIDEKDYKNVKKQIFEYKIEHFKGDYIDSEIHVHELYKSKPPFTSVLMKEKYQLLDNLYKLINQLPISIISVAIDKSLFELFYDKWNLFTTAWSILFQRCNSYLQSLPLKPKGSIRIDKSTKDQHKEISEIINTLQNKLTKTQKIQNIVGNPFFVSSESSELIQISDAISYCTLKHLSRASKFEKYWNLIEPKYFQNNGQIDSYGLNIFPTTDILATLKQ